MKRNKKMKTSESSVIIVGSGIAGLYAALKLAENNFGQNEILLITKSTLRESNSRYAQGGIVGVLSDNNKDSFDLHVNDTIKAGAGLTDIDIARFISENSPDVINDLISYGVEFDKDSENKIALTLEAAHSVNRILHSGGDGTGRNIERVLSNCVEKNHNIHVYEKKQAVDLLINNLGNCSGIIVFDTETKEYEAVLSPAVIIATGGVGQVYSNTTNPKIATGDGIALAYRANAIIQDMEFIQFHPTALTISENDTRFLVSESVRGEGARLKNNSGEYFVKNYDSKGDLAPRDIVTRAIFFEMTKTQAQNVFLDTSLIDSNKFKYRFPNIINACINHGIDIEKGNIPVSPAAHYCMGGIKITKEGKTNIEGLYAVGEAGCNSLHGANRLASNSLLECAVIAAEVAKYLNNKNLKHLNYTDSSIKSLIEKYTNEIEDSTVDITRLAKALKEIMWEKAGIVRNEKNLTEALIKVSELKTEFNMEYKCNTLEEYEFRNLLVIAELIIKSAIARKESRGAHFREDYLNQDTTAYHSYIQKGEICTKNELSFAEFCR